MNVSAKFLNTDSVDVTITITMSMRDWKALHAELPSKWPAWKLGEHISEAVRKLESNVSGSSEGA